MPKIEDKSTLHAGHRQRLIRKFEQGELLEHELLEMLLFNAFARRNTNDLAHRLLAEFGSIQEIFNAEIKDLCRVEGIGVNAAAYLACIGKFFKAYEKCEKEEVYPEFFDSESFFPYVKSAYNSEENEVLDVYLISGDMRISYRKRYTAESDSFVEVDTGKLARLINEKKPSGIVLVHNHPKGRATPSETDDAMTKQVQIMCSIYGVLFLDHIIYSHVDIYSYYSAKRMQEFAKTFSLGELVKSR